MLDANSLSPCASRLGPGLPGVGLAGPGLPRRSVQPVSAAVLPVGGRVGGRVSVGGVDQRPLSLSLPILQRCHRLQDLRLAAADSRSAPVLLGLLGPVTAGNHSSGSDPLHEHQNLNMGLIVRT